MTTDKKKYWLGSKQPKPQDEYFLELLDPDLWESGTAADWDTCWFTGMPKPAVFTQLSADKSINHIPGNNGITVKSLLFKTLEKQRALVGKGVKGPQFDFYPAVFDMPDDYIRFQQAAVENPKQLWIVKPKRLSRGRGIRMVQDPALVPKGGDWIVQAYIENPHLFDGHKYVLRCYALITSVEPLRVYLHKEGFAKLASEEYSTENIANPFVHLTNPDVNAENAEAETPVVFIPFKDYREWLRGEGMNDSDIFEQIKNLTVLTGDVRSGTNAFGAQ